MLHNCETCGMHDIPCAIYSDGRTSYTIMCFHCAEKMMEEFHIGVRRSATLVQEEVKKIQEFDKKIIFHTQKKDTRLIRVPFYKKFGRR